MDKHPNHGESIHQTGSDGSKMDGVKRYDAITGYIVESEDGECVLFSDYEKLQARVRELEEVINQIPIRSDCDFSVWVKVEMPYELYDRIQSLKGTP